MPHIISLQTAHYVDRGYDLTVLSGSYDPARGWGVSVLYPIITVSLRAIINQCHCHDNNVSFSDCYHENGKNYRGMVRKTRKGITCQKWNVNTPHRTKYDVGLMLHLHNFWGHL